MKTKISTVMFEGEKEQTARPGGTLKARAAGSSFCTARSLAAETIFMALVIFMMLATDRMRILTARARGEGQWQSSVREWLGTQRLRSTERGGRENKAATRG
jgi:hypothetical protein